jgi:hypothetical protein
MKKIMIPPNQFVTFAMLLISSCVFSQRFEWVNFTPILSGYPNGGSGGQALTADNAGNLYSLATLSEAVVAGNDTVNPFYPGSTDIYLTKWSPQGNVLWAKPFGGTWFDNGLHLDYDAVNNRIFASCFIQGAITVFEDTTINNATEYQIIVFDTTGAFVTTHFTDWSNSSFAIKDSVMYYTQNWTTINRMKLDGTILWSVAPTSVGGYFFINNIAITPQHDVIAAGIFQNSFVMGGDTVYATSESSGEASFLFKVDSTGQVVFARYLGSLGLTYYNRIPLASDELKNTYLSDRYAYSGLIFGNDTLPVISSGSGAFIAKFDSTGNDLWGKSFYGTSDTRPYDLSCSGGNLFCCGTYTGTMVFGSQSLPNYPYGSCFISKMDTSGDYIYAKESGTMNGSTDATDLVALNNDYIYITGMTYGGGNASFGCYTQAYSDQYVTGVKDTAVVLPEVTITQYNSGLVSTYDCDCSVQWYLNASPIDGARGDTLSVTENGDYYAEVVDNFNCSAESNIITILNASIGEVSHDQVTIGPNPFQSSISISLHNLTANDASVIVTGSTGQVVYARTANNLPGELNTTIDLSALKDGIYFLKIVSGADAIVRKIVKM